MRTLFLLVILSAGMYCTAQNSNYEKAWQALSKNNRTEAASLLKQAVNEPNSPDAYLTYLYLQSYNGKEAEVTDFKTAFFDKHPNPYPYVYSLWFNKAVMGNYGKKTLQHQVKLMNHLIDDGKAPGTLVAASNYHKGMDALFSADFNKMQRYLDAVGNIRNWQYAGPFENISGSGIYKDFGPLAHPEPNAQFISSANAPVTWITPASEIRDGWTPVCYQFNRQTAVVYAQNFIQSPEDMDVLCNIGCSGSVKVWVNDELVLEETKELLTEMDALTVKVKLNKGTNRVLVQLGYTSNTYPNFTLRVTDASFKQIPGITGSSVFANYKKAGSPSRSYKMETHFAEKYFLEKISQQPNNLLNYMLLCDVYLRSKKVNEARNLMDGALKISPDNSLLRMKLVEVLIKENNRTSLLEEIEKIKQLDPESVTVMDLNLKELFDNEKFEDGADVLEKRIRLHGIDESTYGYKILLLIHEKKYEEMVKLAEKMYAEFPANAKMIKLMYSIKKEVYKDNKGALKIYDNYMKDNYDYEVYSDYAEILSELGNSDKAISIRKMIAETFPYSPSGFSDLSRQYFTAKKYDKAEEYINRALQLSPYNENYKELLGDIKNEQGDVDASKKYYAESLLHDPNQYEIISKVRKLEGKPEIRKLFAETDINALIKADDVNSAKNTDYGYYYILDQKNVVVYPGGATEEYCTVLIKITNEKGVDSYKQSSIGYNSSSQNLLIEKAEVMKKGMSKLEGERNGNEIVFTNLEVGDVVVFQYRIQHFSYGRFAKDFWDRYYFGGQIYSSVTRYNLMLPASQKLDHKFLHANLEPKMKDVEGFRQYTWEMVGAEPLANESLMPVLSDIGAVLHVSTVPSWNEIAGWYSDVCNNNAEQDFEIIALYNKLFPDPKKAMTQYQKAKTIYEYIEANIRYSSVSFRQSGLVPQRASTTLITRLGDCKDLSSLFVTLAGMAGIKAQMVLVNTRNNGQKEVMLPSMEFNHCIAKANLDNKDYYLELTDNYLPFGSLSNNLNGAAILEIPLKSANTQASLSYLKSSTRTRDIVKCNMEIKPEESDLNVQVKMVKQGNLSSGTRNSYHNLDKEKQIQEMESAVAKNYKNNVKVTDVTFSNLDKLYDSVNYAYSYKVKNEVAEIGTMKTFKVMYPNVVATLDNFSSDTRKYPIEYWSYEDADQYETTVNVLIPAGYKFVEMPASETLSFGDMKFSIQYTLKAPGKLQILRKFSNTRQQQIAPEDYVAFKAFFEKIVKAEQKFIAYKKI